MTITSIVLLAGTAGAVAHAAQPRGKVTLYLLDRANERYMDCTVAQALAGKVFAAIGISLEWAKGEPAGESSPPPIIIELVTGMPENFKPGSMAYASPYEGSHITVLVDRIEKMRTPSNVLAHVLVHEITHILQGVSRHSATGVMKERWTAGDFSGMRFRPLSFTPLDIELIYSGLAQRAAGTRVLVCDCDSSAACIMVGPPETRAGSCHTNRSQSRRSRRRRYVGSLQAILASTRDIHGRRDHRSAGANVLRLGTRSRRRVSGVLSKWRVRSWRPGARSSLTAKGLPMFAWVVVHHGPPKSPWGKRGVISPKAVSGQCPTRRTFTRGPSDHGLHLQDHF